jgi:hypothetical protein
LKESRRDGRNAAQFRNKTHQQHRYRPCKNARACPERSSKGRAPGCVVGEEMKIEGGATRFFFRWMIGAISWKSGASAPR